MLAKRKNAVRKRSLVATGVWMAAVLTIVLLAGQVQAEEPAEEVVVQDAVLGQSIQTISFKKDMPITDALRMLAQMYEKNIVPSAGVDGIVTVTNLYDVTFEEAMQAILGTHKYEVKDNFIKVFRPEHHQSRVPTRPRARRHRRESQQPPGYARTDESVPTRDDPPCQACRGGRLLSRYTSSRLVLSEHHRHRPPGPHRRHRRGGPLRTPPAGTGSRRDPRLVPGGKPRRPRAYGANP